jgi:hypothetical protein
MKKKRVFPMFFFLRASKRRKPRLTGSSGAGAPSVRRRDQVRTGERKKLRTGVDTLKNRD